MPTSSVIGRTRPLPGLRRGQLAQCLGLPVPPRDRRRRPARPPVEVPDAVNRCAALGESVPQSLRQQELVCLTSAHVNCPRYLRGTSLGGRGLERVARHAGRQPGHRRIGRRPRRSRSSCRSAFVVANGGLTLTAAEAAPSATPTEARPRRTRDRRPDRDRDRGRPRPTPEPRPPRRPRSPARRRRRHRPPPRQTTPAPTPSPRRRRRRSDRRSRPERPRAG